MEKLSDPLYDIISDKEEQRAVKKANPRIIYKGM